MDEKKIDIYLDYNFLIKIASDKTDEDISYDFRKILGRTHYNIFNYFNENKLKFNQDDIIRLFQNPPKKSSVIKPTIDFSKIENKHSFFFIEYSDKECYQIQNEYGFICLNYHLFREEYQKLFKHTNISLNPKTIAYKSWDSIFKNVLTGSYLIIKDRYAFKNELEPNIFEILTTNFLKSKKNQKYFIKIYHSDSEYLDGNEKVKRLRNNLTEYLKLKKLVIDPNNINIIFKSKDKYHSREIINNYYFINSTDSFNLYINKNNRIIFSKKSSTDIDIYPILYNLPNYFYKILEAENL